MANRIPTICGTNRINPPDSGCTDCGLLEQRVAELERTRLVKTDLIAGEGITLDVAEDSNEVTINAVPPVPKPYIEGADDVSVRQGIGIDLTDGVKAYDGEGSEIPFTVEPTEIDKCDVGIHDITYSFADETKVRKITITQIANPTINSTDDPISVKVNEEFDALDGVSAVDGNGNEIEVTVEQ